MRIRNVLVTMMLGCLMAGAVRAENEVGFIERFALAPDREAVLGQLVPGTEDHYFFHALHYQNTGQAAKLGPVLEQWARRFPDSARRRIIENRGALLAYDADPQATLRFLRERLGVFLEHAQEVPDRKPDLPTVLDPVAVGEGAFLRAALEKDGLDGLELEVLERLVREEAALRPAQRRALLARMERPDVPRLLEVIAEDLKTPESRGFGEFGIHRALLVDQLDRLRELVPAVATQQAYVQERIRRLAPGGDADWETDPAERTAWLDRLWEGVKGLPPSFNSLKAHVLHARLKFDRSRGVYDRARFVEYLKLPRRQPYMSPKYLEQADGGRHPADLNARFDELGLGLPPVGSDEGLVRDYLLRFSVEETGWEPWTEWLRDTWVKPVFAEAKITAGVGDPEQWASFLTPAAYQALRERVDVEFAPSNPEYVPLDGEVAVEVYLKNTPKLLVRLFEINTLGYHLSQERELNTDLALDGLVANTEQVQEGEASPFRRVSRTFRFPELKGRRGAWMVELIGGGKSSRALIRKGRYALVQRTGAAGEWVTVLDESRRVVTNAVAWLDGRRLVPDAKEGRILIPFTENPGRRSLVLADADGGFASRAAFEHTGEGYRLDVQFHLEREQVLARREAVLGLRTMLRLGGEWVAPEILEDVRLRITTTTHEGIDTVLEVRPERLSAERLLTQKFRVPDRVARVSAVLEAKVPRLTRGGEKEVLEEAEEWVFNAIDTTEATHGGFFTRFSDVHVFELLGRNGEPMADRPIRFKFHRRGFGNTREESLATDARGRIVLGRLDGLSRVEARLPDETVAKLTLEDGKRNWPSVLHVRAGDRVEVPWDRALDPAQVSLLELRGGVFFTNRFGWLKQEGAFLVVEAIAAGDYSLRLRADEDRTIVVRATAGEVVGNWLLGRARSLEVRAPRMLQVEKVSLDTNALTVQLANWNRFTRVHVAATRFLPGWTLFDGLGGFPRREGGWSLPGRHPNLYSGGRDIGDEYRYILDRRYATKYPGNMLTRPGLLLNPWETRTTDTQALDMARRQDPMAMAGGRPAAAVAIPDARSVAGEADGAVGLNLDFLSESAPVLFNLVPDTNGVVRVPAALLGDRHILQVHAETTEDSVWGLYALGERATAFRDVRLDRGMDAGGRFAEVKEVRILGTGATLTLTNLVAGELETYDTLGSVFRLYGTLSPGTLNSFGWLLEWPKLDEAAKRSRYSEFASHEVNFFLSRKDPRFFAEVVQPYLKNKKDKTFLDEYLLGMELTRHLEPWAYGRLNAFERALLGRRIPGEATNAVRHLREQWELRAPDPEAEDQAFETALRGLAMETSGAGGAVSAGGLLRQEADKEVRLMKAAPIPAMLPGAPAGGPVGGAAVAGQPEVLSRRYGMMNARGAVEASEARKQESEMLQELADAPADALNLPVRAKRAEALANAYYRRLGPTKEWAENNYYRVRMQDQGPDLVPVNAFWRDYAAWDGRAPFLSTRFHEVGRSRTELLLALAVLDLPFEAPAHVVKVENATFSLTAAGAVIVFQKQYRPVEAAGAAVGGLLVSESYFRNGDRYRMEGNEKFDKFVSDEFLPGVVYGAHVVVGNPGSAPVKVDLLTQIPSGAIPVKGSRVTESRHLRLDPYATQQLEYYFYFPAVAPAGGAYAHFPAHATVAGASAGMARALAFRVVRQLTQVDTASWAYVSQQGTEEEVFRYLDQNNLLRLDLERIAWRARGSVDFFRRAVGYLRRNHVWSEPIHRYALVHNDPLALSEWLRHQDAFVAACGEHLETRLLRIDPIERRAYEHLEYTPLVNQRAHRVGADHRIANPVVRQQYQRLLGILAYRRTLDPMDQLSVVYHLFLQDRVEEALARLKLVPADGVPTQLQLDYLRSYAAMYEEKLAEARAIASRHVSHPVDRWRRLFGEVVAQLDEIEGRTPVRAGEGEDREQQLARQAAAEPTFDFKVENRVVQLSWRNLGEVTVNFYLMDPEFLFSSSPFVASDPGRFSVIKPTLSVVQALPAGRDTLEVPLPARFAQANVLVEVLGGGRRRTQAYHANTFRLSLAEGQGRLEVRDAGTGGAVTKAYVKVYARLQGGGVRFLKDGYTDLRGRFDYASLNDSGGGAGGGRRLPAAASAGLDHAMLSPGELDKLEKIAVLVLSEKHGAAVREVDPPRQ